MGVGQLTSLALWLGVVTIFLWDGELVLAALGSARSRDERVGWLVGLLLFALLTPLLMPWRLWAGVVLVFGIASCLMVQFRWERRMADGLEPAPIALVELVRSLAVRWNAPVPARILVDGSGRIGPAVVGLLRPTLILPATAVVGSHEELVGMVAHELAHLRHRDGWKAWLVALSRLLLGWHPTARAVAGNLALEMELAADRQAVDWIGDARSYARTIVAWAARLAGDQGGQSGLALARRPGDLVVRMRLLLEPDALSDAVPAPFWLPTRIRHRLSANAAMRDTLPTDTGHKKVKLIKTFLPILYAVALIYLQRWI